MNNRSSEVFDSPWSSDSTALNMKLSSIYNSNIKGVDCFVAYWLFAAFIKVLLIQSTYP